MWNSIRFGHKCAFKCFPGEFWLFLLDDTGLINVLINSHCMHLVTSSSLFSMFFVLYFEAKLLWIEHGSILQQVCVRLLIFSVWATRRPWLSISWGICIWANWTSPILWAWRARLQRPMQTSSSRCGQAGTTQWSHVYLRWATSCGILTTAMITCIFLS